MGVQWLSALFTLAWPYLFYKTLFLLHPEKGITLQGTSSSGLALFQHGMRGLVKKPLDKVTRILRIVEYFVT